MDQTLHLILSWLVWADIECAVHVALPKWPINNFKLVKQSRQQVPRAYCPNLYTVIKGAQAVVILAMTANGKLLPPFLVLKVSTVNF